MANMMPFGREAYIRSSTQERDIKYFTEQQLELLSAALWNIQAKGCVYGERKGPHCGPWLTVTTSAVLYSVTFIFIVALWYLIVIEARLKVKLLSALNARQSNQIANS